MTNNILENHSFLNELSLNEFFSFFSQKSCFPSHILDSIFNQDLSLSDIEESLHKTQLFLSDENYDEIREIYSKLQKFREFELSDLIDVVSKEGFIEANELNLLVLMIEYARDHKSFLNNNLILHKDHSHNIIGFYNQSLKKSFRSFVDTDGNVNYKNHPLLKSLFFEQVQIESKIRSILQEYKVRPENTKILQHDGIDILNDRFVLAYKSDCYNSKIGNIISRSESGRTLYIEPQEIRSLNFSRLEIVLEIKSVVDNLLRDVVKSFSNYISDLLRLKNSFMNFDQYFLKSTFANHFHLTKPVVSSTFCFDIKKAFHPLIKNPVANSIKLSEEDFSLVISGPNTGGKTAFIKTICLIQTFFNNGLFVPATEATLYPIDNIFYFGADQQDLESGLSSFSSEVKNYNHLIQNLDGTNLIIIDEIFNSTSSEEASALAIAMFDYIKKVSKSKIIVSTHHQTLKTLLHSRAEYLSSHVGFDHETLKPTYKLHVGIPGGSQALDIFKTFSPTQYSEEIYRNAARFLDNKSIHYEKLLNELAHKEDKLDKILLENKKLNQDLKNQKEASMGVLNLKVQAELEKTKDEFDKIIKQAYGVLEDSKKGKFTNSRKLYKEEDKLVTQFNKFKAEEVKTKPERDLLRPKQLTIGCSYFCSTFNQDVSLKDLKGKSAIVTKGALRITVPTDTLYTSVNKQYLKEVKVFVHSNSEGKLEYDCRGMRLSEFQSLVESTIYELESGNVPFLNFIHGHGEGILKKWLRKYIKNNKGICQDMNENTNDGETRIVLDSSQ